MILFGQKNQSFSTIDLLTLVGLVGGIGTLFGVVLAQAFQDDRPIRARMAAENLARQIEGHRLESSHKPGSRGPASVESESDPTLVLTDGDLGKDPWGQPFHYAVRETQIYVWSDGPNGQSESQLTASLRVGGDDVGHARIFKAVR